MTESDEVLKEFLVESAELLDRAEQDLMALESAGNPQALASIFRDFHTIKGTAGFYGFAKLQGLTHAAENVLGRMREGKLATSSDIISTLLSVADGVRKILASIEASGQEGIQDYKTLIANLQKFVEDNANSTTNTSPVVNKSQASPPAADVPAICHSVEVKKAAINSPDESNTLLSTGGGGTGEVQLPAGANSTVRVDIGLLEKLMNLVGELVLTRNQLLQFTATQENASFVTTSQRLNLITTELQEGVMKARMQPIDNIWSKFPRVVRDLSLITGKKVRIEMEGRDTELDRTIIEAIKDPLTHTVRNSLDHGIESPEKRRSAGKQEEGRLFLRAFHEGGQVNIEVSDDGCGIDVERVKQKAIARGIVSSEQVSHMNDREIMNFIFLPGFSTAEKITNVSGRGVGMDVVRTNIEKIGGTVDIQSIHGQGTTLKIKIPLTLAIIPALIITCGKDRYAIPQVSLLELVRLEGDQAHRGVEMIQGAPVYRLRGNLLPLVYLARELKIEEKFEGKDIVNIVVLQADNRQFGLVVDDVNDTEEIVVKPLGKQLKGIPVFAGATIMGDGCVALILDVLGLAQCANVVATVHERTRSQNVTKTLGQDNNLQTLLILRGPDNGRLAVPLSSVSRLEEFELSSIEAAGHLEVVQYRSEILPLVRLSDVLEERRAVMRNSPVENNSQKIYAVVFTEKGRSVGLVVDEILDIVEELIEKRDIGCRAGVLGSAVIQGRVTELLDIQAVLAKAIITLAA